MSKPDLQKINNFLLDNTFEVMHKGKQVRVVPVSVVSKALEKVQYYKELKQEQQNLQTEIENLEKLNKLNNMLDETLRKKPLQAKARIQPPGT